jgi:hypothetical protein
MRGGPLPGAGRVPVRVELPLLALSRCYRVGVQPFAGIEREKLELLSVTTRC